MKKLVAAALVAVAVSGCVPTTKGKPKPPAVQAADKPAEAVLTAGADVYKLGDWRVRVDEVRIGELWTGRNKPITGIGPDVFDRPQTLVFLAVGNAHKTKRNTYRTFYDGGPTSLDDELGNNYRRTFPDLGWHLTFTRKTGKLVKSVDGNEAVDPLTESTDCLAFSAPVEPAQTLTLTLSATNLGGKGNFKFAIPASMFRK